MTWTNKGSGCASRGKFYIYFWKSELRQWTSWRTHVTRQLFSVLLLAVQSAVASISLLPQPTSVACSPRFQSFWRTFQAVLGESLRDVWTLYTILTYLKYLYRFYTSYDTLKPFHNIRASTSSIPLVPGCHGRFWCLDSKTSEIVYKYYFMLINSV